MMMMEEIHEALWRVLWLETSSPVGGNTPHPFQYNEILTQFFMDLSHAFYLTYMHS